MSDRDGVLVTGGAGYIGSHVTLALLAAGRRAVVLDDLSTGRRSLVPDGVPFVHANAGERSVLERALVEHRIGAVMHFAGSVVVPESVTNPLDYYRNNTLVAHGVIEACVRAGVGRFVFSSSAAVYGLPERLPVDEDAPTAPINPYGASKLMTEWMLRDAAAAHGLRYAALRYFNVAGADPAGRSGQCSMVATHLIKIACEVAVGRRSEMAIFGDDYPTPDGTCLRDYIHVCDLADAHVSALARMEAGGGDIVLNCGYGRGCSVREIIDVVSRVIDRPLPAVVAPRRRGDPPALVADPRRAMVELDWRPRFDDPETIIRHALAWEEGLDREVAQGRGPGERSGRK